MPEINKLTFDMPDVEVTPCIVDTDNVFEYKGIKYKIDKSVKQYEVHNTPKRKENGQWNDWTNEAKMDRIYVLDDGEMLEFYDQDKKRIKPEKVLPLI